jgi:hypothetical protein
MCSAIFIANRHLPLPERAKEKIERLILDFLARWKTPLSGLFTEQPFPPRSLPAHPAID